MVVWILAHKLLSTYLLGVLIMLIIVAIVFIKDIREHGYVDLSLKDILTVFLFLCGSFMWREFDDAKGF